MAVKDPRIEALQSKPMAEQLEMQAKVEEGLNISTFGFDLNQLIKRFDTVKAERSSFSSHWQDIAEVISPGAAVFNDESHAFASNFKTNANLYDTTGSHSNELLSSGFFSLLTSPTQPWFQLLTNNEEINKRYEVNVWLNEISRIMAYEIQKPQTGFTTAAHEFYLEYGAFGNGTMFVTESQDRSSLVFIDLPLAECYYEENDEGRVDTLWRRYWRMPYQLIDRYGEEGVHDRVRDAYLNPQAHRRFEILHVIMPNKYAQSQALFAYDLPFISVYIDKENKQVLSVSGFNEQPFMAARFYKMPQEIYGRGPGTIALPDLNMLQEMMRTVLRGAQKIVDPPLMMPDQGFINPPNTAPGRVNYYRAGSPDTDRIAPLITQGRPDIGLDLIQSIQNRIREIFFVDQLQLNIGPQMTATEVLQRTEEKQRLMGPVIGRASTELLSPMIVRAFGILSRMGKIPEPPKIIMDLGAQFRIAYTSPIFKAQEQVAANSLTRALQVLLPFMSSDPTILEAFHPRRTAQEVGAMFNLDKKLFRTDEEIQALQEAKQQAAEQEDMSRQLKDSGIGIRNLAQAGQTMRNI